MEAHWEKHVDAVKTRAAGELPLMIEKKWVRMAEYYLWKKARVGVDSIQQIMAPKWEAALEANAVSDDVDPNAEASSAERSAGGEGRRGESAAERQAR